MDGLYNIDELANSFVEEYELQIDKDGYCSKRYKQSIRRAMERLGILGNYVELANPKTNHLCNYYSAQQREFIKNEPKFHDYLLDNSTNDAIRSGLRSKQIQEAIDKRRAEFIEHVSRQREEMNGECEAPCVSEMELNRRMALMMLTALFEERFTSFNRNKLRDDMELVLGEDELGLSSDAVQAEDRLAHPEGHYFKRLGDADSPEA